MQIWVFGIAGLNLGKEYVGKLVYAMQIAEILSFEEYWADSRFKYKFSALNDNDLLAIERGEDQRNTFAFWRSNNDYRRCGDNIRGTKDKGGEYVLVSDTFIYHGAGTHKQKDFFIHRFDCEINNTMRPYRIYSSDNEKPISANILSYIKNEFKNDRCTERPIFSAEDFSYLIEIDSSTSRKKDRNEDNPLPKRIRHC